MRLKARLPFRRIALVLAGGGAFGAYEVGALRALRAVGLDPKIVAGVSVGALNAVTWIAHAGDLRALERTWGSLRPSTVGIRWALLGLRALGGFLFVFGALETLLLLAGVPETAVPERFSNLRALGGYVRLTGTLELLSWLVVAAAGIGVAALSHPLDEWLGRTTSAAQDWLHRVVGAALIAGALSYVAIIALRVPWPLRFHLVVVVALALAWVAHRPGPVRSWVGPMWLRLMPETAGRGLWRNAARRELLRSLVRSGDPARLVSGETFLIVSACDVETGRIVYFVNRPPEDPRFEATLGEDFSEVVVLTTPREIIEAAVASSAVPLLYEPLRFRGRPFLDGGLFANHPLQAVTAAGADAVLLVLVSPSAGPRPSSPHSNLVEIAGRLSEIANWRDLQGELQRMPGRLRREEGVARICVVEPERPLEGGMFDFRPERSRAFIQQGERDALRALERAGWVEA